MLSIIIVIMLGIPFGLFNQISLNKKATNLSKMDPDVGCKILDVSPPILIDNNTDFASQSSSKGWPGQGTELEPYILQNLNISNTESGLIHVRNTDCHFIITDCFLSGLGGSYWGIVFSNVSNAQIINTTSVHLKGGAFSIWGSKHITIMNCTSHIERGDMIGRSSNIRIINNTLNQTGDYSYNDLLTVDETSDSEIRNNTLFQPSSTYGIKIEESNNNVISDNLLNNSSIFLRRSEKNTIINNTGSTSRISLDETTNSSISKNKVNSLSLSYHSKNNTVQNNTILSGLSLRESGNNVVVNNTMGRGISIYGDELGDYIQRKVVNNTIKGKKLVYWQHVSQSTLPVDVSQIILINCSSIDISNREFTHESRGLYAVHCTSISVEQNNFNWSYLIFSSVNQSSISNNEFKHGDLNIYSSNELIIENNQLESDSDIDFSESKNCSILDNNLNNPYQGVTLSHSDFMEISNNEIMNSQRTGIELTYSDNTTIIANNVSHAAEYGIYLLYSDENSIHSNRIWNSTQDGIYQYRSDRNKICFNVLYENLNGIMFSSKCLESLICGNHIFRNSETGIFMDGGTASSYYPKDNFILNNLIYNNDREGILLYNSGSNDLLNNTIYDNGLSGLYMYDAGGNLVSVNSIFNNNGEGVSISSSSSNDIIGNTIYNNIEYGINITSSNHNEVYSNNFIDNNLQGDTQAYDVGHYGDYVNIFEGNFWSEWTEPDINDDGFVDVPYEIDGEDNTTDAFPLTSQAAFLTSPLIIHPQKDDTVSRVIEISWYTFHSQDKDVTYSIQVLNYDYAYEWFVIASDVKSTTYIWDSLGFVDGECYLRIVAEAEDGLSAESLVRIVIHNHFLTDISIISPASEDKVLTGTILVEWTSVNDSLDHSIVYDVFISPNGGIDWEPIETGVSVTKSLFDTTSVPDGFDYKFKVVARCAEGLQVEKESDRTYILNYLEYMYHDPIYIENNSDFESQASLNGWDGDGSETTPYIIEGYNLTSIEILDPQAYFIIRNCLIFGGDGILLMRANAGVIEANIILETRDGVELRECYGINISNNRIFDCYSQGIHIRDSRNCIIIENLMYGQSLHVDEVILLQNSQNCTIEKNNLTHNSHCDSVISIESGEDIIIRANSITHNEDGIFIRGWKVRINNNTISNNNGDAIYIGEGWRGTEMTISYNSIFNNRRNGIRLDHCYQSVISDNIISHNGDSGIFGWFSGDTQISNNIIYNNDQGITLRYTEEESSNGPYRVIDNYLRDNRDAGLYLQESYSNVILNNRFENNGITMYQSETVDKCLQSEVRGNTINGKPIVFWQNERDKRITQQDIGQIILINCESIEIIGLELSNCSTGIVALHCNNLIIASNTITSTSQGIYLGYCSEVQIYNNHLLNIEDDEGIYVYSGECIISHNVIQESKAGISISKADRCEITNNWIQVRYYGITISYSSSFVVSQNTLIVRIEFGISIRESNHGFIQKNLISCDYDGIRVSHTHNSLIQYNYLMGSRGYTIDLGASNNNTITQNIFIFYEGYREGDSQGYEYDGENNTFTMNFWSEWPLPDANSDGFGDTPYPIDRSPNFDYYPLIVPPHFMSSPILNTTICYQTISGVTEIEWLPCNDSLDHTITYSLYYSRNNGKTWNLLVSDLIETIYSWDTTTVFDGEYLLKLVCSCEAGYTEASQTPITFKIFNNQPPPETSTLPTSTTSPSSTTPNLPVAPTSETSVHSSEIPPLKPASGWSIVMLIISTGVLVSIRKIKR